MMSDGEVDRGKQQRPTILHLQDNLRGDVLWSAEDLVVSSSGL